MIQGVVVKCRNCGRTEEIYISSGPDVIKRFFYNDKTGDYKSITEKCKFKNEIIIKKDKKAEENERVLKLSKNFKELKTLKEIEVASHFIRCKDCKGRTSYEIIKHIFK